MKKFIFALLFFMAFKGIAQPAFGIRGGANLADQRYIINYDGIHLLDPNDPLLTSSGKETAHTKSIVLPSAGIFYYKPVTSTYGIQADLLYQGAGAKSIHSGTSTFEGERLAYIMLPVTVHYNLGKYFSFSGGQYISYLIKGAVSKVDYGYTAGAEIKPVTNVSLGVAYYFGIHDIDPGSFIMRNRIAQVYVACNMKALFGRN